MIRLQRITDAATEPITTAELVAHSRIDTDGTEDALLAALITASRQHCEDLTGRAFLTQTWRLSRDRWPASGAIELPRPRLLAVSSVQYVDQNGATQTWAADRYQVDASGDDSARLLPAYLQSWPDLRTGDLSPIQITYTAGYGASAATVPQAIRQAVTLLAATMYEHREAFVTGAIVSAELPFAVRALLGPYRVGEALI